MPQTVDLPQILHELTELKNRPYEGAYENCVINPSGIVYERPKNAGGTVGIYSGAGTYGALNDDTDYTVDRWQIISDGNDVIDITPNPFGPSFILTAQNRVEQFCNRTFLSATYTENVTGDGTDEILTRQFPVSSITSIVTTEDSQAVDSDDYYILQADSGIIRSTFGFENGVDYTITYVAGYTLATIPYTIKKAIIKLSAWEWKLSRRDKGLLGIKNIGGNQTGSYTYDSKADEKILKEINSYRIPN